ncbi:hypothetical protein BC628DRAFT_1418827 [Trametes gibbosa]|nr:hypothetical protein BC628DRAFT_1418827 [Trametes gibbosa]
MSTYYAPESSAIFYSQMVRAASMFSDTFTSISAGSAITARWMEGGCESSFHGSTPPVATRCARLEAEVFQLRKRLNTEMRLLPIVKSTDAGGLTCEFMFPADKGLRKSSATMPVQLEPAPVSHPVQECDVAETDDHVRTEVPQNVDSEGVEEACVPGFDCDVKDSKIVESPSVDVVFQQNGAPIGDLLPSPVIMDDVVQIEYDFPVQCGGVEAEGSEHENIGDTDVGYYDTQCNESVEIIARYLMKDTREQTEEVGVLGLTSPSKSLLDFAFQERESTNKVNYSEDVIMCSPASCEEELPSSIGTLIKWSRDTFLPLATTSEASDYADASSAMETYSTRCRANSPTLELSASVLADVFELGLSGAYRSVLYSPMVPGSLPWLVLAVRTIQPPCRFIPAQSPSRLLFAPSNPSPLQPASLSIESPTQTIPSQCLRDVYVPVTSPLLPGAWQWSTSYPAPTAVCDDLRSITNDILNFLLLAAFFCYLLSTPALSLFLSLWFLWGSTISLPPTAMASTSGHHLRPFDDSLSFQDILHAPCAQSLLVPRLPLAGNRGPPPGGL